MQVLISSLICLLSNVFFCYCIFYGILYKVMYITQYGCAFLKLGESTYVAMDLIPILLGSLPLAHNAQHSLVFSTSTMVHTYTYQDCTYMYLRIHAWCRGRRDYRVADRARFAAISR